MLDVCTRITSLLKFKLMSIVMNKLIIIFFILTSKNIFAVKEKLENVFEKDNWYIKKHDSRTCSGKVLASDKKTTLKFRISKINLKSKDNHKNYVDLSFRIETDKPYASFSLVADKEEVNFYVSRKKGETLVANLMPPHAIKTLKILQKPAKNAFIKLEGVSKSKKTNLDLSNASIGMKFLADKCPEPSSKQLFIGLQ